MTNHRKALFCQQQQKKGKIKIKKQINKNNEISDNEREVRKWKIHEAMNKKKIFGLLLAKRMYHGSHKFSVTIDANTGVGFQKQQSETYLQRK